MLEVRAKRVSEGPEIVRIRQYTTPVGFQREPAFTPGLGARD